MLSCGAERRRRRKFSLFVVNFSRNFQNFGQKSQLSAGRQILLTFLFFADTTTWGGGPPSSPMVSFE